MSSLDQLSVQRFPSLIRSVRATVISRTMLAACVIVSNNMVCLDAIVFHRPLDQLGKIGNLFVAEFAAVVNNLNTDRVAIGYAILAVSITYSPAVILLDVGVELIHATVIDEKISRRAAVTTREVKHIVLGAAAAACVVDADVLDCTLAAATLGEVIFCVLVLVAPLEAFGHLNHLSCPL